MTERQKETAFLKQAILFDGTGQRGELEDRIARVQRDTSFDSLQRELAYGGNEQLLKRIPAATEGASCGST